MWVAARLTAISLPGAVLVALFFANSTDSATRGLCVGNRATTSCLKDNFRELYSRDYDQFWEILFRAEKRALRCVSVRPAVEFLEVAGVILGNAEVGEYFSEVLETKFIKKKPKCLLDALTRVDQESRKVIIRELRIPTHLSKAEVRNVLSKFRQAEPYREVLREYFEE